MAPKESGIFALPQRTPSTLTREQVVAFFDRRQVAYDNLNAAALAADYTEDCVVDSPFGGTHQGRAAVEKVFRGWFDGFPDLRMRPESLVIEGNHVVQETNVEGSDIGGFMGVPATGKSFHFPAVLLYELRGRQIARERRIYDFTGLLVQIGILKAKPA